MRVIKGISLDYDGVLNNMMTPYLKWLEEKGIETNFRDWDCYAYPRKHFPHWATDFWKYEEHYSKCEPFEEAIEFMVKLSNRYPHAVINIVTSTPEEIDAYKDVHITKYFGEFIDHIYHVNNAWHKWQHTKDTILVDDFFIPLLGHSMINKNPCILFNLNDIHPWVGPSQLDEVLDRNRNYCTSYEDVLEKIDEYMQSN